MIVTREQAIDWAKASGFYVTLSGDMEFKTHFKSLIYYIPIDDLLPLLQKAFDAGYAECLGDKQQDELRAQGL